MLESTLREISLEEKYQLSRSNQSSHCLINNPKPRISHHKLGLCNLLVCFSEGRRKKDPD